nr:hypothetical protein Itr_chr14CG10720 [Ipomoea trifida]
MISSSRSISNLSHFSSSGSATISSSSLTCHHLLRHSPAKHPSSPTPNAASTGDRKTDLKPTPLLVSDLKSGRQQCRSTTVPDSTVERQSRNRSEAYAGDPDATAKPLLATATTAAVAQLAVPPPPVPSSSIPPVCPY